MAEENLIGVVTVTFNSAEVLPAFLRCVANQSHHRFILFAVDNDSGDDTLRLLQEWGDVRLVLIANPDNRGVAEGNNQGIRAALEEACDSVLLINNDTEFDGELFRQLDEELKSNRADMLSPKIMFYDEPKRIWCAGGKFRPFLGFECVHFGEGELDHGQYETPRRVDYVPTCCVLISKNVFATIGLMDARYFVYADDTDFMYRAMKAGVRLMYIPRIRILHKVSSLTGGADSRFATHYGTRNRLFFLLKHFGLLRTLPWMLLCQVEWSLRSLDKQRGPKWLTIKRDAMRESLEMWRSGK